MPLYGFQPVLTPILLVTRHNDTSIISGFCFSPLSYFSNSTILNLMYTILFFLRHVCMKSAIASQLLPPGEALQTMWKSSGSTRGALGRIPRRLAPNRSKHLGTVDIQARLPTHGWLSKRHDKNYGCVCAATGQSFKQSRHLYKSFSLKSRGSSHSLYYPRAILYVVRLSR